MNHLAIDKNILSFLLEVSEDTYDPLQDKSHRVAELISSFRIFLHAGPYLIGPTVKAETKAINDDTLRKLQTGFTQNLLVDLLGIDPQGVENRAQILSQHHNGLNDCRIVAEAELGHATHLITFDKELLDRLSKHAAVHLVTPSTYWSAMKVPKGTRPGTSPAQGHPHYDKTWWNW